MLAIGLVLDPRFKMDLVEYYYDRIYGDDSSRYVLRVRNAFLDLFNEYGGDSLSSIYEFDTVVGLVAEGSSSSNPSSTSKDGRFNEFDKWYKQARSSTIRAYQKLEFEQYLEEPIFPIKDNFNILHWWKVNSAKLPILSRIARDILAVPVTTVASEAAFSVGGRVIDESRASLLPDIVEALITTSDWIESKRKRSKEINSTLHIIFLFSLILGN